MFEALERLPVSELTMRHASCRERLAEVSPEAGACAGSPRMGS